DVVRPGLPSVPTRRSSDLHHVGRRDDVVLADGGRIPAPHEALRPAERRRPERVAADVVVCLLDHPLPVLRGQHGEDRRNLAVPAPVPVLLIALTAETARTL